MSMLADGHVTRPATVEDAIAAWCQTPGSRYIAGGTDLVVNIRRGITRPNLLVDLSGIEDLNALVAGPAGVTIGTGVTIAALARNPEIASRYRAVAQAAESIAGPGHRNVATVGGNLCLDTRCVYYNQSEWWRSANNYCLKNQGDTCHVAPQGERCHAAFSGDLAPALIALNATVDIEGARGPRRIPLADLYVEDGKAHLALDPGELVVAVNLPLATQVSAYQKVRTRGAIDFPLAGVAVALTVAEKKLTSLRIALTGTNSRPFLLAGTDAFIGKALDDKVLQAIDRAVQKQAQPMRTTIASSNYRRLAAAALARRVVAQLYAEAA